MWIDAAERDPKHSAPAQERPLGSSAYPTCRSDELEHVALREVTSHRGGVGLVDRAIASAPKEDGEAERDGEEASRHEAEPNTANRHSRRCRSSLRRLVDPGTCLTRL